MDQKHPVDDKYIRLDVAQFAMREVASRLGPREIIFASRAAAIAYVGGQASGAVSWQGLVGPAIAVVILALLRGPADPRPP